MITKISQIKGFGVYQNFRWGPDLKDFSSFNLIYGWNYAGKTTLSRIFRSIELRKLHQVDPGTVFEFEDDASNVYDQSFARTANIKVFNSDYVSENIGWDDETINPILLIGEESILLKEKQRQKREEKQKLEEKIHKAKNEVQEQENIISYNKTNIAREIGNLLSIRPFDKRHFEHALGEYNSSSSLDILNESKFDQKKGLALSNENRPHIPLLGGVIINFEQLNVSIKELLGATVSNTISIEELVSNQELNAWVKVGFHLHKDRADCAFCGNPIGSALLDRLSQHFSKAYEELETRLNLQKKDIENRIQELQRFQIPDKNSLFPEYQSDYENAVKAFETEKKKTEEYLSSLIERLNHKLAHPFKCIEYDHHPTPPVLSVEKINEIIELHNKRSADFEEEKRAAVEAIKRHFASTFIRDEKYFQQLTEIEQKRDQISKLGAELRNLEKELKEIDRSISSTAKGAEQINEFLKSYFGKEDVSLEVTANNKYQLIRKGKPAKNLSEGEKTALAFAYFMASLKEKGNELKETIVYIDDPVSSLDSNHLFNTYSFIKSTFYQFDQDGNPKHVIKCKQLFISTHNFEFLNLVKDWFFKLKEHFRSFHLIEKEQDGQSKIKGLPVVLQKYKSEYNYLFSLIYDFAQSPAQDFHQLYNLPNIIRRFLESFLAFKYQANKNIDNHITSLIPNPIQSEKVRKFVHYHSHSLGTSRLIQMSNMAECREVAEIVLNAVKDIDPIHYEHLEQSVQD